MKSSGPLPQPSKRQPQSPKLLLLRLQAEAFRRHGISRQQFLKLTPSELRAINADALAEWELEKDLEDRRTARVIAAIFNNNPNRTKNSRVFEEDDFIPKKRGKQIVGKSADELLSSVMWRHAAIYAQSKKNKQNGS